MSIVIEAPDVTHRIGERILASVAERRVAKVVGKAQGLGEILVEAERSRDRPPDLRNFEAVCQSNSIMIAIGGDEHLRLMPEPAERDGMDDPVPIALEDVARAARSEILFGMSASAGPRR